jgi:N-dimethylarginine dimethylaminohydrolase
MTQPWILMCPPDYYGIEYEINPWMSRSRASDADTARAQWRALHDALVSVGAKVSLLEPKQGLPDLVFTANAALIYRQTAVLSRFRHAERQGEEPIDEAWLTAHGFTVRRLSPDIYFEGAGDALFCGDTLFAGYRIRSHARGHQLVGELIGARVIPVELTDDYHYHLDTCFCPVAPDTAIYYPAAFDEYGLQALRAHIPNLIAVEREEARRFACNAVVVGKSVVTNTGCSQLHAALKDRGFEPHETPLDEFVKAGGSAKCLTLRLDGEDAAAWRTAPAAREV